MSTKKKSEYIAGNAKISANFLGFVSLKQFLKQFSGYREECWLGISAFVG